MELKNGFDILVGQAVVKLWIKTKYYFDLWLKNRLACSKF